MMTEPSAGVRITVTFAGRPATASSLVAPLLYNKTRVLQFEEDDSPRTIFTDVYPLFEGGVAGNGQVCPGLRFSDGCGHSRPYTAAVAINGHNPYNNSVWLDAGSGRDASKMTWVQAQELLDHGWDIENHSDLHTASSPAPAQQLATLDALIGNRLQGYKPTVHIVPTNFAGYPTAAFAANYVAVSSASQSDGLPMLNRWTDNRVRLLDLPATPFVYQRYNADQGGSESTAALLSRLKMLTDNLMAPGSSAADVYVQRVFAHIINFSVLKDWMDYTQSIAQDQLWVTTLREFEEYRRMSRQVVKTEVLSGNTLTIDLDYTGVSANTRFQNLTLLINSPEAISGIAVSGTSGASYNLATKQVNVFNSATQPPALGPVAPLPVALSGFTARRESTGVRVGWRTASELRASHFDVERAADERTFALVGTVAAVGTSTTASSYTFLDATAVAGSSWYYRLAQLDTDGTRRYSPVIVVGLAAAAAPGGQVQVRVAPNPAHAGQGLSVTLDGCTGQEHRQLLLFDAVGRVVLSQPVRPTAAAQTLVLSLPDSFQPGLYTLRVVGGPQPLHARVLITQ